MNPTKNFEDYLNMKNETLDAHKLEVPPRCGKDLIYLLLELEKESKQYEIK